MSRRRRVIGVLVDPDDAAALRNPGETPALITALEGLPGGEYRAIISITRIRRGKDGTEKSAEHVSELVHDFAVKRGKIRAIGEKK